MPWNEKQLEIHKYSLEEQLDIYLAGEHMSHGSGLWFELARNGESMVPTLTKRLATVKSNKEKVRLLYLFVIMDSANIYSAKDDPELMRKLDEAAASVGGLFRDQAVDYMNRIRD
jgi:hypothetical protein